ncbi:Gti1/Pac2 family-domain-containing protein [Phycomyces nitens]|nr:Gti1/Pac2 family-domain-containing protein [Phycomyces nitens]
MESFIGYIKSPQDALIIFEACRRGQLNRVQRRLSSKERVHISSGSVFAWDEREAGMRRWTDGRTWSPSRVLGSFLTYRELDTKRRPRLSSSSSTSSLPISKASSACSYKTDGLIKQSFSICTATNQKLHLISYYSKSDIIASRLKRPSADPLLSKIVIPKGLYPELNPLDTSGGHSATVHNMRQDRIYRPSLSPSLTHQSSDSSSSDQSISNTPSSPPSLSSSPCTSDEDLLAELPQSIYTSNNTHNSNSSSSNINSSSSNSNSSSYTYQDYSNLPTQDIAWERLPCSEDRRQLSALQGLVRL